MYLKSVVQSCIHFESQAGSGGQVVVFAAVIPTIGLGALKNPDDDTTLYGTDKEKTLFTPRNGTWEDLAVQCAEEGIGVSMFLGQSRPIDVGSVGEYDVYLSVGVC